MMSSMVSSGSSSSMMSGMQGMRPHQGNMQQNIQERFVQDFGQDALASIQNTDGTTNMDKLDSFMASQGIEKPSGPPPMMGGSGMSKGDSSIDTDALLARFTSDFGDEATSQVTNEDGSLNFEKLKSFFDEKMQSAGMQMPSMSFGQMDDATLLDKLTSDFGDQAVSEVTNEDGSINQDKLKSFIDAKIASGEMPAPSASVSGASDFNMKDLFGSTSSQNDIQSYLIEMLSNMGESSKGAVFSMFA